MLLAVSALLALLPLLGIAWIVLQGSITTVDGLFTSLILLAISGTLGLNFLFALRKKQQPVSPNLARAAAVSGAGNESGSVRRGRVESVEFFEANVGLPNKSLVALSNGSGRNEFVFDGDLRNALPVGKHVQVSFRRESGHNILLEVSYC